MYAAIINHSISRKNFKRIGRCAYSKINFISQIRFVFFSLYRFIGDCRRPFLNSVYHIGLRLLCIHLLLTAHFFPLDSIQRKSKFFIVESSIELTRFSNIATFFSFVHCRILCLFGRSSQYLCYIFLCVLTFSADGRQDFCAFFSIDYYWLRSNRVPNIVEKVVFHRLSVEVIFMQRHHKSHTHTQNPIMSVRFYSITCASLKPSTTKSGADTSGISAMNDIEATVIFYQTINQANHFLVLARSLLLFRNSKSIFLPFVRKIYRKCKESSHRFNWNCCPTRVIQLKAKKDASFFPLGLSSAWIGQFKYEIVDWSVLTSNVCPPCYNGILLFFLLRIRFFFVRS